jgi:hypothetical protein
MLVRLNFGSNDSIHMVWMSIDRSCDFRGTRSLLRKSQVTKVKCELTNSQEDLVKEPGKYPIVTIRITLEPKSDFLKEKTSPQKRKGPRPWYNLTIVTMRSDGQLVDYRRTP